MAEMRLHFLGATRTVTGSQYLLETDRARVLIDCGMFQGSPNDVIRNRVPFAYSPNEVDALLLTHAHLDHCGLIPHLSASGFKGMIYATKGSVDLTRLVLLDSAKLQEEFSQSHQRFAKRNPDRAAVEDEETMAELAAASKEDPAAATREAAPAAITALREPQDEAIRMLGEALKLTGDAKGVLLVPSFAIGRTQEIVYELNRLLKAGTIPHLPLYLDSPMAQKASDVYRAYLDYFDDAARALVAARDSIIDYPDAIVTNSAKESLAIEQAARPFMVLASNGMITGGRIVQHVKSLVGDPGMTLLFVGYQGDGTLGASLQQGAKQVRIDGQDLDVRCQVRSISGFSAHADEPELLAWLGNFTKKPRTTFIVHGDPAAQAAFEPKVRALGFATAVPAWRETVELA